MNNASPPTARRARRGAAAVEQPEAQAAPPSTPVADQAGLDPLQQLLAAMTSVRDGDFSVQLPPHWEGISGKLADAFNDIVSQNRRLANDLARVAQKVGGEGRTRQRVPSANRQGQWAEMEASVNGLIRDMARPIETMTEAMAAVAKGDLSRKITVDVRGEILQLKEAINTMVDQLRGFASEVTRVAREVGSEGKLGGQAQVRGVAAQLALGLSLIHI